MVTLEEEIRAAEEKMRQACAALMAYVTRPESEPTDIKLHYRLADDKLRIAEQVGRELGIG